MPALDGHAERLHRFECAREQPIPHQLALPPLEGDELGYALALLADHFTPVAANMLALARVDGPEPVLLDTETMAWRSESGRPTGNGLLELGAWLRDRSLLRTACLLRAALTARRALHA